MAYSANNPYAFQGSLRGDKNKADQWEMRESDRLAKEEFANKKAQRDFFAAVPMDIDAYNRDKLSKEFQSRYQKFAPTEIKSVQGTGPVELQKTLAMRESALQGFNAPELAAQQAQLALGQQNAQQQRERALQATLARQGIKGGAAAALQAQQAQQAFREKGAMDTEMMLKQAERQRQALGEYETGVTGAYNLAQRQQFQKMLPQLAAEMAAQGELGGIRQLKAAELYQQGQEKLAQMPSGGCCSIAAIITYVATGNGISEAKANELINKSKQNDLVLTSLNKNEYKFVKDLDSVRFYRDNVCSLEEKRGYYIFSEKVLPLIKNNKYLLTFGYHAMVKPAIDAGNSIKTNKKQPIVNKVITKSWKTLFKVFATKNPFKRKNGEIV